MAIPTIHVGCTHFALGRLQALVNCEGLFPVACVDINLDDAREGVVSLEGDVPEGFADRIYTTITEARARHHAEACLIYASTPVHAKLVVESLNLGMHTLCVKPIATTPDEFQEIIKVRKAHLDLMLVQGQNKRWNPAASKMREWLRGGDGIGEMLGGECRFWIRQNLWRPDNSRYPDAYVEGIFFHAATAHQLDQLVAAKGLPKYITACVHQREDHDIARTGVWGTAGGVKPIATTPDEFQEIIKVRKAHLNLMLVQGQNKRWNPAASKMREWLRGGDGIGEMLGGECRFWIRQNLWRPDNSRYPDAYVEGIFFHAATAHQLDQLVAAKGLPKYITACVHQREDHDIARTGVWGTAGGQALLEYPNGAPFCYTGTNASHANPFGWSGHWTFHGENGDIRRDAGHLQLFRKGECVEDCELQDLHPGLIEDDRLQFDAFADTISTGRDREWLQETTLGTWILMEACNTSARMGTRVNVEHLRAELMNV